VFERRSASSCTAAADSCDTTPPTVHVRAVAMIRSSTRRAPGSAANTDARTRTPSASRISSPWRSRRLSSASASRPFACRERITPTSANPHAASSSSGSYIQFAMGKSSPRRARTSPRSPRAVENCMDAAAWGRGRSPRPLLTVATAPVGPAALVTVSSGRWIQRGRRLVGTMDDPPSCRPSPHRPAPAMAGGDA